eukprot:505035_1
MGSKDDTEEDQEDDDDDDGMVFNEYDETNTDDANESDEDSDDGGLVMLTDSMNEDKFDMEDGTDTEDESNQNNPDDKVEALDKVEEDKFYMEDDESDDSEDLPPQVNVATAMKQQYLSASDGYVVMEKNIEKRNAHRLPFRAKLQQIESQKKLKNKPKKSKKDTIHEIIKEKKHKAKQEKTERIIKILKELNKADLNNVNNEMHRSKMTSEIPLPLDDFNEEELKELTLIAQESVKHLPAKKPNDLPGAKPTLSNSKSVGFTAFPGNRPSQYGAYASPFDPRPPNVAYNGPPPSHYYYAPHHGQNRGEHGHTLDNINETAQSNPNDNKSHSHPSIHETQSHTSLNKMGEYKVEGLADSGPNCAVDHMQDRIRLRQMLRKQKGMGHSISETKSSAAANRRQLMLKTKAIKGKMRMDDEDKLLDNQLFHETAKLLKSDSEKRKHLKLKANKPYISTDPGAMPPLPATPQDAANETDMKPSTRPMLRHYHSDGPPDGYYHDPYGAPPHHHPHHAYYSSHGHYSYYSSQSGHYPHYPPNYPYHNPAQAPPYPLPDKSDHSSNEIDKTEKEKNKGDTAADEDPMLRYIGAFEPQTKQNKMKENEKKLSLPLHQKSSPPDFLYPRKPEEGDVDVDASHAFASAFTTAYRFPPSSSGPQHPPRPTIDPYASSNPVNHRKIHIYAEQHRPIFSPKSPESQEEPQAYRPLVDSCSCKVSCAGKEDKKESKKKDVKKTTIRETERKIENEHSAQSKESKRSKGSGFDAIDAIDNEWVCSDYEEAQTKNNSALSSVENKMIDKSNEVVTQDVEDDTPKMSLSRGSMRAPIRTFVHYEPMKTQDEEVVIMSPEVESPPESQPQSEASSEPRLAPLKLLESDPKPVQPIIPQQSEQRKLDLNRSSVVKEENYVHEEDITPKLMDRSSKVMEPKDEHYQRPQMSSRHSSKVAPLQGERSPHKKKRKNHKNRKNHNAQYQPQQQQMQQQQQQYVNYNQYPPQTPTTPTIAIPYLSSVPMVNAAATTPSGAPPLNRSTTAPSGTSGVASNTQLNQLQNTVEQLRSHFVQLLQHLPLTTSQQQQFNSVHQISNLLQNANQSHSANMNVAAAAAAATAYYQTPTSATANSVNSSYSTPNIGLNTVSANNLLNTNGANIIIQKQSPQTPNQYQVNPQNVQNMQTVQNMQNMMFCSNNMQNTMNTSQPNMPNYTFSNIPNPALSSIPMTLTAANPYGATATTPTVAAANNAYLLQTNNLGMPNGFNSTPQAMQVGLYPNTTTQQTPTSANNTFNLNMHHQ